MTEADKSGDSVRAVGRALDILMAFTREDPELSATELAQRVDLSRPTLYRLLYTLEAKGFISSVGDPQRFRLGPAVARVSQVWSETLDLARVAEPVMRRLWAETRETVALWVRQGEQRFCVAEMPSPQPLNLKRGVGSSERIARGASGRAILAFGDVPDAAVPDLARIAGMSAARFRKELETTRECGYATSRDELIAGAVAVAAPFFDDKGVAGSIGVFGPAVRLGEREVRALGKRVVTEAGELSRALGREAAA